MMHHRRTPTCLNNGLNEKRRKTNGAISNKSIQKDTPFYWNSMDMRDRKNVMTSYPKEDVIKLNELT